jgi:hypothetical protein
MFESVEPTANELSSSTFNKQEISKASLLNIMKYFTKEILILLAFSNFLFLT